MVRHSPFPVVMVTSGLVFVEWCLLVEKCVLCGMSGNIVC